jgi:hypothetical protein
LTQLIASKNWKHVPWLLGVAAAPLCVGGQIPEAQALVGGLLGLGLICCAAARAAPGSLPAPLPLWSWGIIAFLFIAPLVPLPESILARLSPGRVALAHEFPVDLSAPDPLYSFSCSFSMTLLRVWGMSILLAGFVLARRASREPGFAPLLYRFLIAALCLLCVADLLFRRGGGKFLLGLWPDRTGHGAATFANRNHFADWVCMAVLFGAGAVLRRYSALRSARGRHASPGPAPGAAGGFLGASAMAVSVGFLVATGSRGGVLALFAGSLVWLLLLARRGRSRARLLWAGLSCFLVLISAVFAGGYLLSRMREPSLGIKFRIWADTLGMLPQYGWFGTGWGAFERVFNLRKSFGGGVKFLHAENEYVQLLFEAGLAGSIPLAVLGLRLLFRVWRRAWAAPMPEPEFYLGALAALSAFLVHSLTEFVWQVLATALLAAVLLGYLSGASADAAKPEAPAGAPRRWLPGMLAGVAVLAVAAVEGFASWQWASGYGRRENGLQNPVPLMESSLRWWPWAPDRQLLAAREEAVLAFAREKLGRGVETPEFHHIRDRLNQALRSDPYNWQLRLERALFDFSYGSDAVRARGEALETVRLNPLNPRIPLQFAGLYVERDPEFAFELLRLASAHSTGELPAILDLAWRAVPEASRLWSLTPETPEGWLALGDFAAGHNLKPLAIEAYSRLKENLPAPVLADRFLRAGLPGMTVTILGPKPRHASESLLLCRAYRALGGWQAAMDAAEAVWRRNPASVAFTQPRYAANPILPAPALESQPPQTLEAAERDAEAVELVSAPLPASVALQRLHDRFPGSLRLHWLALDAARRSHQLERASALAEQLAARLLAAEPARASAILIYNSTAPAGRSPIP